MMCLTDVGSDLRWVVTNLTYHSSEIQSNRLKHISLPVCPNQPVRNVYKSALTGLFGEFSKLAKYVHHAHDANFGKIRF